MTVGSRRHRRHGGKRLNLAPMLRDELRRLLADQREVATDESASDSCLGLRRPGFAMCSILRDAAQRMTKAQSVLAVLQADNRNTLAMRSGPSCSSMIVSERRTYLSDFAASEAPALKNLESISTEMRDGAGASQVNIRSFPHATLPYQSLTN
jgi:hypothetical protein